MKVETPGGKKNVDIFESLASKGAVELGSARGARLVGWGGACGVHKVFGRCRRKVRGAGAV